jgi:Glu-tRNA(Gln) amidotransferase subunit E-like FAD-binding protein
MHKVKSTYKVLAYKLLEIGSTEEWIDWALEMMEAGFETEHLVILAGLSPHLNRFEFDDIVNKTLKELSLETVTIDEATYGYVYYLIDEALNSNITTKAVLDILREICRERDYDSNLFNFYLLAFAQEELKNLNVQFYWEGADHNNIDSITNNEFQVWKNKYESMNLKEA